VAVPRSSSAPLKACIASVSLQVEANALLLPNDTLARGERAPALAAFLRRHRAEVVAEWERCVRVTSPARDLPRLALLDHVPPLLDAIADVLESSDRHSARAAERLAMSHGETRLQHGFDLEEVTAEYAALRSCVIALWSREAGALDEHEVRLLNAAIDQAIGAAVRRYVEARTRTLQALDRFSSVALHTEHLDELLQELLAVLTETMPVIDTATILLMDGDHLRIEANTRFDGLDARGEIIRMGEGFAGSIVERGSPRHLIGPEIEELVVDPDLPGKGLQALYGVPLSVAGKVIGVAHMGSRTASGFSSEDCTLFTAMAERAANVVHQRAMSENADRLIEILEAGDPCFIMDAQWRVTFVNRRQERISRTPAARSIGRPFWEVWPQAARPDSKYWTEYRRVMRDRVPVEFDEYYAPLDLWTHVTAYPTEDGGMAAFIRDINDRKRLEEARERFIAVLGHDLRTPLSAISMSAQTLLSREELHPSLHKGLSRIMDASARMARIISDVLDWATVRQGDALSISREPTDLASVCERVVAEAAAADPDRTLDYSHQGSCYGSWDAGRMEQVVSNLVANAIQHGSSDTPVRVLLRDRGDHVTLEVHNEGAPIPGDRVSQLYEPFFSRRPENEVAQQGNLGLGLYIVARVVDAHHGRVQIESSAETGTTFRVSVPKFPNADAWSEPRHAV
jgi:signal transduction histidine kinase